MPEDLLLFSQIQQGDQEAFKQLFELYHPKLVAYALKRTGNLDVSRGLAQEVFVKIWEHRKKLAQIDSPVSYLFTAIHNRCLNHIRNQKLRNEVQQGDLMRSLNLTQNEELPSPFLKEALYHAIESLPLQAKRCFIHTQIEGKTIKEVAQDMNLTPKTVENQLGRARKILRKKLKKFQ